MDRLDDAQRRLLRSFDDAPKLKGKGCGKFNGDVCCRILSEFLSAEIGSSFEMSQPNAYLRGYASEFDLLIVKRNARPDPYTNAFDPACVKAAIEVKANGVGYSADPREDAKKLEATFETAKNRFPQVQFFLVNLQESSPKKPGGIDYWQITRDALKPFESFCFRNRRGSQIHEGEWGRLVEFLKKFLQS